MLSAWCSDHGGLVVGQLKADSKANEITALPELLRLLAIQGWSVTMVTQHFPQPIEHQLAFC